MVLFTMIDLNSHRRLSLDKMRELCELLKLKMVPVEEEKDVFEYDSVEVLLERATCSEKNPYEDEHSKAFDEFHNKYGLFGSKLQTEKELEENKKRGGGGTVHFMNELPEYRKISEKYDEEQKRLEEYRRLYLLYFMKSFLCSIGVSYTALFIRLRFEYHDILAFS